MLSLALQLHRLKSDWTILLPHSFRSALVAWFSGVPVRLGYARDGRSFLLSHAVERPLNWERVHHTSYYLYLLYLAGLLSEEPPLAGVIPQLYCSRSDEDWAAEYLQRNDLFSATPIVGVVPGATFGPAKCWPVERFAASVRNLISPTGSALLLGGPKEVELNTQLAGQLNDCKVVNLAGKLTLGQTLALLARLHLALTNDSGLMHAAAALGTPVVAVFGSTNPTRTAPLGPAVRVIYHAEECSPCLQSVCPRKEMICFNNISVGEVVAAGQEIMHSQKG